MTEITVNFLLAQNNEKGVKTFKDKKKRAQSFGFRCVGAAYYHADARVLLLQSTRQSLGANNPYA